MLHFYKEILLTKKKSLFIKSDIGFKKLYFKNIQFIKADRKKVLVYTEAEKYTINYSFSEILNFLDTSVFIRSLY